MEGQKFATTPVKQTTCPPDRKFQDAKDLKRKNSRQQHNLRSVPCAKEVENEGKCVNKLDLKSSSLPMKRGRSFTRADFVCSSDKKPAFTLAEVLITLVIIGVIAAITIPVVIANYREHETQARLNKFKSNLYQAVKLANVDNGTENTYLSESLREYQRHADLTDWWSEHLGKYMPATVVDTNYKYNEGTDTSFTKALVFNDGTAMYGLIASAGGSNSRWNRTGKRGGKIRMYFDTNGEKGPNKLGVDVFKVYVQEHHRDGNGRTGTSGKNGMLNNTFVGVAGIDCKRPPNANYKYKELDAADYCEPDNGGRINENS